MSLDIYLKTKEVNKTKQTSGIFVRKNGKTVEITEDEWYETHPEMDRPVIFQGEETETNTAYHDNITHNLNTMADNAGIYEHLWRPDKINITKAGELIEPLRQGLHELKSRPEHFKQFNPDNGWGTYEGLIEFVDNYLNACYEYPEADVEVDR